MKIKYTSRIFILVLIVFFFDIQGNAFIPLLPLSYKLETRNKIITEGDKVEFVLTIHNGHESETFPILTPGTQNSGKKLIYLRVYDPAANLFVERAIECRDINMKGDPGGSLGMMWLKPGEDLSISFYWNDNENYLKDINSHHRFNKPLFTGLYEFQAFYDPSETGIGDTLYHFMNSTNDRVISGKLTFFGPGISQPCSVRIEKKEPGNIVIDGQTYLCPGSEREGSFYYYSGSVTDSNKVAFVSIYPNGNPFLEVRMRKYHNTEWLQHFENGNILKYSFISENRCPEEYYCRQYYYANEKILEAKTDTIYDGSVSQIYYNENGSKMRESYYSMSDSVLTTVEYIYKEDKLLREKKISGKFSIPCQIMEELIEKK